MFELANERPPHWPSLEIPQRPSDELNCSQQSGEVNSLPRTLPIFLILLLPKSLPVSFQALLLTILDPEIRVVVFVPCFLLRFLFRGEKRDLGGGPVCSLSYLRKSLVTFDQAVFFFSVLDYSCSRGVKYFCPSRVNGRFIKRNEQRASCGLYCGGHKNTVYDKMKTWFSFSRMRKVSAPAIKQITFYGEKRTQQHVNPFHISHTKI